MDQLFAPWRIRWVEREDGTDSIDGCVFCAFAESDDDRDDRVVARSTEAYAILNNYPYNPGHVMVVPDVHEGDYAALTESVLADHARLTQRTLEALRAAIDPDGFNAGLNLGLAASGGSIEDHLHTHVVPRWEGDTNFMPVIGDTKVIVQALEETFDVLHAGYATLDGAIVSDDETAIRFG